VSYKKPLTSKGAVKRGERERAVGLEPEDAAAKWLAEHDPPPPPPESKSAKKSKAVHRFSRREGR
jgi:Ser/Thr protein kinase RdoA (MazF antagonist)